jgi:hypothetical protein
MFNQQESGYPTMFEKMSMQKISTSKRFPSFCHSFAAYERMFDDARAEGSFVYGATILPFGGCTFYYTDYREAARQTVNEWIRNSGRFDGVIDFDIAMRNPADTLSLLLAADSADLPSSQCDRPPDDRGCG